MKGKFSAMNIPYVAKTWPIFLYFLLFIFVYILFLGRKKEEMRIQLLLDFDSGFYTHATNFVLSFIICMVSGFVEILSSKKTSFTKWIAVFLIFANFIYEWYIPILNTPDKVDSYYGFVGSVLPFIYFYFFKKWCLKPNPNYST